jgi:hypothetical protein
MNCPELRRKLEASSLLRWTLQPWHTSHEIGSVSACLSLSTSLDPLFLGIYFEQFKIWTYLNNMFEPFNYSGVLNALLHAYTHHSWYSCNITQYIYIYMCVICLYAYTFIYIYVNCICITWYGVLSWPLPPSWKPVAGWLANFRSHH